MKLLFLGDFFFDYDTKPEDFRKICEFVMVNRLKVILNLECSLSNAGKPIKKRGPNLCGSKNAINALKDLNVVAVLLSNNHIMDYGSEGLVETLRLLDKANIRYIGAGVHLCNAIQPLKLDDNKTIILNYGWNVEETVYATEKSEGCAPLRQDKIVKEIRVIRNEYPNATLIACFHWGFEYNKLPMPMDIDFAHSCCDAGCNYIIGSHPHVIQPKETYKGREIYYSLGNFYFGSMRNKFDKSFSLQWEKKYVDNGAGIIIDTKTNRSQIVHIRYVPHINETRIERDKTFKLPDISGVNFKTWKYYKAAKLYAGKRNPILTCNRYSNRVKLLFLYLEYMIYGNIKKLIKHHS